MAKANTMASYWVPGVNNLKHFGRWEFMELTSIETMEEEFLDFVKTVTKAPGSGITETGTTETALAAST